MRLKIEFRALGEADLPLLFQWLNTPHVAEWYGTDEGDDPSEEGIRTKYLPYINGDPRTSHYITLLDDEPSGLIQWYRLSDYPQYASAVQLEPDSIAIDLFIGNPLLVHRGLGPKIIRIFLADIAFPKSGAAVCYMGPATANEVAKKAYAKAGFQYSKTVEVPGDRYPEYLMRLRKAELANHGG